MHSDNLKRNSSSNITLSLLSKEILRRSSKKIQDISNSREKNSFISNGSCLNNKQERKKPFRINNSSNKITQEVKPLKPTSLIKDSNIFTLRRNTISQLYDSNLKNVTDKLLFPSSKNSKNQIRDFQQRISQDEEEIRLKVNPQKSKIYFLNRIV